MLVERSDVLDGMRKGVLPVGSYCCVPAGGNDTPWHAPTPFTSPSGAVLTISAQTGGHVEAVERFAVTGVRRQ